MRANEAHRARTAATATASALGLEVDDAVVLHDSNKLTLRLQPCNVVARVAPEADHVAHLEIEVAQRLARVGAPVAALEPRVAPLVYYTRDGFAITLWTYYKPRAVELAPSDYAEALQRLHAGMRAIEVATPHFTDRVEEAQQLVADRERTPELLDADRALLDDTLRSLRRVVSERSRGVEQLLHGEPHPGNVLATADGPRFIDLETCCRGPVEFDLAHAPEAVAAHYSGVDAELLRACRTLVLAMVTGWRWDREDQLPNGRQLREEWLAQLRADLDRGDRRSP